MICNCGLQRTCRHVFAQLRIVKGLWVLEAGGPVSGLRGSFRLAGIPEERAGPPTGLPKPELETGGWRAEIGCWGRERAPRVFPTENVVAGFRPDGIHRDIPQERPERTKRAGLPKPETQRTRKSKTADGVTGTRATGDWAAQRFFAASGKRRESLGSRMLHYL